MLTKRRNLLCLALLIATVVALRVQWPRIQDPYTIQDDFRKFHWLRRFEDPELFTEDPLTSPTEIHVGPLLLLVDEARPGYTLLFFLASPLIPPVLFSKLLIFPLLLISVYFLFRIGEIAKDPGTGFTLALTFTVLTTLWTSETSVAASLPRSFMAPLLLGIVYFLMVDRYWLATGVALVAATIYLPGAVLGFVTIALATIEPSAGRWRYRINWRRALPLVAFLVVLLLMSPLVITRLQFLWDSLPDLNGSFGKVLSDPNYVTGGRWPLFRDFPFQGLGALANYFMNLWLLVILTPLAIAIQLLIPAAYGRFPRALKLLFGASIIMYALSWIMLILTSSLVLYFPSRYTQTSLPLVLLLFVAMNLGPAIRTFWTRFQATGRGTKALTGAAWIVTIVAIYFLLRQDELWNRLGAVYTLYKGILLAAYAFLAGCIALLFLSRRSLNESVTASEQLIPRKALSTLFVILLAALVLIIVPPDTNLYIPIEQSEREMMDFFQTLPKDSLTAGNPCSLDYVPMATGRQVLFSCEFWRRGASDSILDNFRAYYSDRLSEVREFCQKYGVDYFVVVPDQLDNSEPRWIFSEPYNSMLQSEITSKAGYVLADIPSDMRVYEGENLVVMQCVWDDISDLDSQATQVDGLGILSHSELPLTISQAGEVDLVIKWMADKELHADYNVCFLVKDETGNSNQDICEPLSPDLPTSQWQIPEITYQSYRFQISPYLESGNYSIEAYVSAGEATDNDSGIPLGEIDYSAMARNFSAPETDPESPPTVTWSDAIALTEYQVSGDDTETLQLDVRWHSLKRLAESYKIFAHVRKPDTGEIVSQIDTIPRNWTYPTDWWEANEIITDTLLIPLKDIGSGPFELWLGWYNEENGQRLPLSEHGDLTLLTKEEAVRIYEFERSIPDEND